MRRGQHAGGTLFLALLLALAMLADRAHAQSLSARYSVTMLGIPIGEGDLTVKLGRDAYSISANGGAAGVLAVFMDGKGNAETTGKVRDGRLVPASFVYGAIELGERHDLKMTLNNGVASTIEIDGPPPGPERVPVKDEDRHGIADPLSALIIHNEAAHNEAVNGSLAPASCNRTLPIFDGRRRYDLVLSFKRVDPAAETEAATLVCNIVLRPISGHRAKSPITSYIADQQDMELAFAPIAGTRLLAPVRLSVPTLIGTMAVQATQLAAGRGR
jgi:uncharacterized protein DUF3108